MSISSWGYVRLAGFKTQRCFNPGRDWVDPSLATLPMFASLWSLSNE
jgi:hypothetical protein